jgi:hypothetical protein
MRLIVSRDYSPYAGYSYANGRKPKSVSVSHDGGIFAIYPSAGNRLVKT